MEEGKLGELKKQTFRRTLDELHDSASSILLLALQWKDIEDQFDSTHNSIDERLKELHSIHKSIEHMLQEVKKREADLELVQDSVELRFKEVERREKEFESIQKKEIQERRKHIEWIENSSKKLDLVKDSIERKFSVVDEAEKRLQELNNCIEEKADQVRVKDEELKVKEKQVEERFKEIELKEKQLQERYGEVGELKVKQQSIILANTHVKVEPQHVTYSDANLYFTVNMDGKALQIFLNEHRGEYDSIRDEVLVALGFSADPAKLVLDAMQGFYPPHLKKEFKSEVVRKSCILLLEQLMKLSPEIRPDVKSEAMKLSFNWMTKMKVDADEHFLEVLGFLQLLASYGLASAFDSDELLFQLEVVAHHSQARGLFRTLGLADKLSGVIQNLIKKKQHIEAFRLMYASELVNEFQPVLLLKDYLKRAKTTCKKMKKADNSLKGQIEAADKKLAAVRCALRCIEDYKIEYGSSLGDLKRLVINLEKQNSTKKAELTSKELKVSNSKKKERKLLKQKPLPYKKRHLSFPVAAPVLAPKSESTINHDHTCIPTRAPTPVPAMKTQSQQLSGTKRPRTDALEKDDENGLHGADQAKCTVPLDVKLERSSQGDLAPESKGVSPASKASSATAPNTELKQQSEIKHPRIGISSGDRKTYPKKSIGCKSAHKSMQHPERHPPDLFMNQGVPYMHPPLGHYSLRGYPHPNMRLNFYNYNADVMSSYHWSAFGNSGHNWTAYI